MLGARRVHFVCLDLLQLCYIFRIFPHISTKRACKCKHLLVAFIQFVCFSLFCFCWCVCITVRLIVLRFERLSHFKITVYSFQCKCEKHTRGKELNSKHTNKKYQQYNNNNSRAIIQSKIVQKRNLIVSIRLYSFACPLFLSLTQYIYFILYHFIVHLFLLIGSVPCPFDSRSRNCLSSDFAVDSTKQLKTKRKLCENHRRAFFAIEASWKIRAELSRIGQTKCDTA